MTKFADFQAEDRRLCILRLLKAQSGYTANGSILHSALRAYGHRVSRDQVRTDLAWLEEQGLITIEEMEDIKIATAAERGVEAASGTIIVPGVKRPSAKP